MAFHSVLTRGVAVANASPWAVLYFLLLLAPQQFLAVVAAGSLEHLTIKPGEPPSPALLLFLGVGFLSLLWLVVLAAVGPWLGGGTAAQLRDRIRAPEQSPAAFVRSANAYYVRMLLLFLLYLAALVVVIGIISVASIVLFAGQMQPAQLDLEAIQERSRHPLNLTLTGVSWLLLTGIGMLLNLGNAAVVAEDVMPWTALSQAFNCCRRSVADAVKLYLTSLLLFLPLGVVQVLPALFGVQAFGVRVGLAGFQTLYLPYLIVLNLGIATSLYHARRM